MTSYATKKLTQELQKAVASRPASTVASPLPEISGQYRVSPEVTSYLQKMSEYRQRAKTIRVGNY